MDNFTYSESVTIAASPRDVYDLVSDITRMGEWSPICKACWWDGAAGAAVGAQFFGRNETSTRTWETHCEVVAADPGVEFAFVVGASFVRWSYRFTPVSDGTRLTETWDFLPAGRDMFEERYGDGAQAQIDNRIEAAHTGIPVTLGAIKRAAETSPS